MARALRQQGFTLLEMIISLLILSLAMILVLNLFPSAMATSRRAEQVVQADNLASSILDEYASKPFTQLPLGSVTLNAVKLGNQSFQPSLEIAQVSGSDPNTLKSLQVTVEWEYQSQTRRTVQEVWVANVRR